MIRFFHPPSKHNHNTMATAGRPGESYKLAVHLSRLSKLIDSNRLCNFNDSVQRQGQRYNSRVPNKKTVVTARRPSPRTQRRRPASSQRKSRRLTHKSTLSISRPSTAGSSVGRKARSGSVTSFRRTIPRKTNTSKTTASFHGSRIYGTTSMRPATERPHRTPGSVVLVDRPQSPIHYPFLISAQDSMIAMSNAVAKQSTRLSPNAKQELIGSTSELMQLRTMVEKSKKVLLDRIDALLFNSAKNTSANNTANTTTNTENKSRRPTRTGQLKL